MHYIYFLRHKKEIVYVGRTKNIKRRISEHKKTKEFDSYEILEECLNIEDAKNKEDKMIILHNPKYNKSLNSCGMYIKLWQLTKGKSYDLNKFKSLLDDYEILPVFADNYSDATIIRMLSNCEMKGEQKNG